MSSPSKLALCQIIGLCLFSSPVLIYEHSHLCFPSLPARVYVACILDIEVRYAKVLLLSHDHQVSSTVY